MRSSKKEQYKESSDRWLVSYADFITLMFAFFTVLYATSDINLEKSKEFQESVKKYLIRFGAAGVSGDEVGQSVRENSPIRLPIPTYQMNDEETRKILEEAELFIENKLIGTKGYEIIQDVLAVKSGVKIVLKGALIFAKNSVKFSSDYLESVDFICQFLKSLNKKIVVEGHVDSGKLGNSNFPSHWEFAASRASIFVRYLIRRHSFSPKQLAAVSYGAEHPLFTDRKKENRLKNQRLELLIITEDGIF